MSGKEERETEGRKTTKRIEESKYSHDKTLTEYTVEEGVEEIGREAFEMCSDLRRVEMVEGVRKIGKHAFLHCSELTEIVFKKGLEEINDVAFYYCSALERVSFPQGTRRIGMNAFNGCSKLTEIVFEKGLEEIDNNAFFECSALERVSFPQGIRNIGWYAFVDCSSLTEITFANPLGDVKFGDKCFLPYSKSLRHVRYGPDVIDIPPEAFVGTDRDGEFDVTKFVAVESRKIAIRHLNHRRFTSLLFTFDRLSERTTPDSSDSSVEYYDHPNLRGVYMTKGREESPRYLMRRICAFMRMELDVTERRYKKYGDDCVDYHVSTTIRTSASST